MEETIDLDIGVTIVAVLHLGTFAKKRIGFVEKEDRTILLCCSEDAPQILFRLATRRRPNRRDIGLFPDRGPESVQRRERPFGFCR